MASKKTTSGNRLDVGWHHGIDIENTSRKVQCKYCHKIFSGGIYRFKHHLACTRKDVEPCQQVPEDVKKMILNVLVKNQEASEKKRKTFQFFRSDEDADEDFEINSINNGKKPISGSGSTQMTINQMLKKDIKEEACQQIARFFYTSAIPFNCVENPEFVKALELVAKHRPGFKPPSYHDIREKYLKQEVDNTMHLLDDYKLEWKKTDTSHISKTANKIFEMLDAVMERIGEENMVQILKKKLEVHEVTIGKGRRITTYIYSRTILISMPRHFTKGKDLTRPAATRFVTAYLTLGYLNDCKIELMSMFTSVQWRSNRYSKSEEGQQIQNCVLDNKFWHDISDCIKTAYPLIKVLRLVDSDETPTMGFIYQAKEKIQVNFSFEQKSYKPIWDIIDARWELQLHRPLHAFAFYLNPHYRYITNYRKYTNIKYGVYDCLNRMVPDE